ncbi:MAG: hypothetical protein HUK09_02515 [Bacteroidaceae bacterium]|nr:hypothetical protein [Bacteroidaceae bacterium]
MKKQVLALLTGMAALTAGAQTTETMTVTAKGTPLQIAISDVQEVTFSDTQLTITRTDATTATFPTADGWSITFGTAETTGIDAATTATDAIAEVYSLNGTLIGRMPVSEALEGKNLPAGVSLIKYNGRTIKVQR